METPKIFYGLSRTLGCLWRLESDLLGFCGVGAFNPVGITGDWEVLDVSPPEICHMYHHG